MALIILGGIMKQSHIFAEVLEQTALDQYENAMELPYVVKGALMPDAHTGYALPIGAVVATEGMIVPSWVGYDIGCGVCAVPTTFKKEDIIAKSKEIFDGIYKAVPVGFKHNTENAVWDYVAMASPALSEIFNKSGLKQLGTLGSGNHFCEVGYDETDTVWIIVHSGSRNLGHQVATHYMKLAAGDGKAREGHFGFRTDSVWGKEYIRDLDFCLAFALENRFQIMTRIEKVLRQVLDSGSVLHSLLINRNHNHAEFKDGLWIHRKGATHAEEGMLGVIPGNMRDGSFVVEGKGNPDALWSSSHGAGRVLGRKAAQRTLCMTDFALSMSGVYAKVSTETLDESPQAYKNIFEVMRQQSDMVSIKHWVKPLINIKG